MPRPIPFTDDQLREAVRTGVTLSDVCHRLGITVGGGTHVYVRRHIRRLGLDISHLNLTHGQAAHARRTWSDDDLRTAVRESSTRAEVLRRLRYTPSGGMYRYLNATIRMLSIDTSQFTGQAWSRGRTLPSSSRSRPLEEIVVAGSMYPSGRLRQRLIAVGLKPGYCEMCGLDSWRGQPLSLALDHINGDPTDNRLVNLRILCPNCHAQTDTWCRRNIKRAKPA